jgi:large subunit ribosomal protein L30
MQVDAKTIVRYSKKELDSLARSLLPRFKHNLSLCQTQLSVIKSYRCLEIELSLHLHSVSPLARYSIPPVTLSMAPTFFRITLLRSGIGLPLKINGVLKALGLTKRMRTVFVPVSRDTAGMIMKVKELVDVQEVAEEKSKRQLKEERRPDAGFYVEKAARGELWTKTAEEARAKEWNELH